MIRHNQFGSAADLSAGPAVLGITGGIGSGKSYVSAVFSHIGVPVYDSDSRTKALYIYDSTLGRALCSLLGEDIFQKGVFKPKVMGSKIFRNPDLLLDVEKLVHPAVMDDFSHWKEGFSGKVPYVMIESAILLEKAFVKQYANKALTVTAEFETRIQRVIKRDNASRDTVLARMNKQWSDEQRISCSDFVIFADNNAAVLPQVVKVHKEMLTFCEGSGNIISSGIQQH